MDESRARTEIFITSRARDINIRTTRIVKIINSKSEIEYRCILRVYGIFYWYTVVIIQRYLFTNVTYNRCYTFNTFLPLLDVKYVMCLACTLL